MKLAWLLLLTACDSSKPAPKRRAPEELTAQIHAFAHALPDPLPSLHDRAFVRPPADDELAWTHDGLASRDLDVTSLMRDEVAILQAYTHGSKSPETFAWLLAIMRTLGHLNDLEVAAGRGEMLADLGGLGVHLVELSVSLVQEPTVDEPTRTQLVDEWRGDILSFCHVWTSDQREQIHALLDGAVGRAKNDAVGADLRALASEIRVCNGGSP